jgi:glycosyltransferase involved in cell wall biosynthesis
LKKRLAIITTHPIQYNAPLFALLAKRNNISIKVFYTWGVSVLEKKYDPGFERNIEWDIPLLEGYDYAFINNVSKNPGSHSFKGIINPTLNDEIENWGANTVIVYGWAFNSHLKCLRYFYNKIPVFFRGDSTLQDETRILKRVVKDFFLRWVYSYVNKAFYVGKENKKYFLHYGLKNSQLVFAPHAIDNARFVEDKLANTSWRKKLNILDDAIVFLFAGKLEPKKNPYLLLNAFMQLGHNSNHLIIVGNGILEEILKRKFSLEKNIHFLPFQNQSEMPSLYSLANVFVLPSNGPGETWGLAVNEAMACGKAVLVSDRCGCANDLVDDGINGFIFEHDNLENLKSKINYLISNNVNLQLMGEKSLNKIKKYNFEKVCKSIETCVLLENSYEKGI